MREFNFTTNIEKRMPDTGEVFCIDRMTSDYAEAHPFDVDGFIESVYQEFAGTEFEESRETLRGIWMAVLNVTSPCGDASLYPNKNGAKRAAAMKVWHKAGDYWRRGLRQGDTLPDMVPMTKITRVDGGWIALFPKDVHLLNEELRVKSEEFLAVQASKGRAATATNETDITTANSTDETDNIEPARNQGEPRQLDLFAFEQLQQENERLQAQIAQMRSEGVQPVAMQRQQTEQPRPSRQRRRAQSQPQRRPAPVRRQQAQAVAAAVEPENDRAWLKSVGYLAAASVALLIIWQTGLIIPLGLIGLATAGVMK